MERRTERVRATDAKQNGGLSQAGKREKNSAGSNEGKR